MPLINIYYIGCMFFSLMSMVWFFLMNLLREHLASHTKIPFTLKIFVETFICFIMCQKNYKLVPIISGMPDNYTNRSTRKVGTVSNSPNKSTSIKNLNL